MTISDLKRDVILALFADNVLMQRLVLKGGNLLDVVYGISTRPSQDIDLSICGDVDNAEAFRGMIERALSNWFEQKGYVVFEVTLVEEPRNLTNEFCDSWGGYKVEFKIVDSETYRKRTTDRRKLHMAAMTVIGDNGKKFPIDISKHEYIDERVSELVEGFTVFAYSPQMLVAEKLRAVCQQMPEYSKQLKKHASPRGRDFLDIHTVSTNFNVDFGSSSFHQTVRKVFQAKRVDVRLLSKIGDEATREYHRPDFDSIAPTVRADFELQNFEFYYTYVAGRCRMLESLWNV